MNIVINTAGFYSFFNESSRQMFWDIFSNFGWLILALFFLRGMLDVYLLYIRTKWSKSHKTVLLAIDIPRGNEQNPKAVENIFSYLSGAHGSINFFEKWFEGQYQKSFSFEIVSLEGYTQFLIKSPLEFRNLVESAIYSQYPDAEISVVDDYTKMVPANLPNEEYDIWGTEFIQAAPWVYPIKLYSEFEHQTGPLETQFKDPMASLMDLYGSLRQGEFLWFQMIVLPTGFDWLKEVAKETDKLFGRKAKSKPDLTDHFVEAMGKASEAIYPLWGDIEDTAAKEDKPKTMMDLTPIEKRKVEGVQIKGSKLSLEAKIRLIYVARRDVINRAKAANGMVGYMKQFASLDLNNMMPDVKKTMTKAQYFFTKYRLGIKKRRIFQAYVNRSEVTGDKLGIYNIEELATLWHFPIEANVKAAMIQKAPGRKADAPASLPLVETSGRDELPDIFQDLVPSASDKSGSATKDHFDLDGKNEENLSKLNELNELNNPDNQTISAPDNLPVV